MTTTPETESAETEREEAAEPAEATQPSTDAAEPDQTARDEPEPTPEDEEPDAVGEGEPLEDVKGIGPAYAQRLRDAGVADVTELANADAERLAEETGLSDKRISSWIDRAKAR
ncbi:helix-hairpin-helix domain-containing protein [Halorussus sp. MSC15.2]|uniref:helix-hairpin-helix domain-containing protein n=1 Tax=Halorussus sp. MSC15.2 TaxID=2283638 RepID=UPI0013D04093|nr:helix-hairpin-helix domain-containing protein [Halorussus sp. MSC15.2]NEU57621.1 helix-hairpin-helix domain-containing protein [Halorussus sp. MSC15.2]